jgi:hypothetical protein
MIYICGDSFAVSDTQYPEIQPWHERLNDTVNLAQVCASNLLISLQVDRAIKNQADYIIVSFTSVTRAEVKYKEEESNNKELLDRFYSLTRENNNSYDLTTLTIWSSKDAKALTDEQRQLIDEYNKQFFDLDLAIYKDSLIIENTLQRLVDSGIPFKFDQGGFEHQSYGGVGSYFTKFDRFRSKLNLWDYADTRTHRPYFHITDNSVHKQVAEYFKEQLI